jgi:hypothetical protein
MLLCVSDARERLSQEKEGMWLCKSVYGSLSSKTETAPLELAAGINML